MSWFSAAAAVSKLLGLTESAGEAVLEAAPALKQSVTLEKIVDGAKIAETLPWADMFSALQKHFSDPEKTASTIEEVLQALAPFIPGVVPLEEVAQVIVLLCKLNLIQTQHDADAPQFRHAPFI